MKGLILCAIFVVCGAAIAAGIGIVVEKQTSSITSLMVFLPMFLANFVLCWLLVLRIMDGSASRKA